ncbi:(d)CMP kinase [Magnetococcales bacterium HHB-1]
MSSQSSSGDGKSKKRIIIAVDGPAGSGKGAVSRAVADRFSLKYLDTGAIYRAVGLLALRHELQEENDVAVAAEAMDFSFQRVIKDGEVHYDAFLDGDLISDKLREEVVGQEASRIAAMPQVRKALMAFQRNYGGYESAILDGRDVGTVVCPDADLKIFLTADLEERAKRRALQLQEKGNFVSFREIRAQMAQRDAQDSGRQHAPMKQASDALVLDTTALSLNESIEKMAAWVAPLMA